MSCALLYSMPLTFTAVTFMLACAFVGGFVTWLWFQWRYRVGILYQRRQDSIDEAFR